MSDEPRDPELENVLRMFGESILFGVRVSMPGRITAYDADLQKCSVKPLIKDARLDEKDERVAQSLPEVHGVPVIHFGPARGRITFPVAVGDLCLIMFCSSSIDRWLLVGGEVDPGDDRRHDLNDAVALVGLHNFKSIPTEAPTDALVLHAGLGIVVKIGGPTGTEPTIMGTTYRAAEDNYFTALEALLASIMASPALATYFGSGAPATVAAAWATAITAFHTAASTYLSSKAEVK